MKYLWTIVNGRRDADFIWFGKLTPTGSRVGRRSLDLRQVLQTFGCMDREVWLWEVGVCRPARW